LVDIGYKSEGLIPASEFKDLAQLQPGDDIEVLLEKLEDDDGMVILSKQRAEQQRNWDRVLETCSEGSVIEGVIKGRVKGGMLVDVGVDAFLPARKLTSYPCEIRTI
jgi:small subunit ribosomal protein S1